MSQKSCVVKIDKSNRDPLSKVSTIISSQRTEGDNLLHLSVKDDIVEFMGFNGACEINVKFPCESQGGSWSVGVPMKSMIKIFDIHQGDYKIELFESRLVVSADGTKYKLPVVEADDSPYSRINPVNKIGPSLFKGVIESLSRCLAKDNLNATFEYCQIFSDDGLVKAWACNNITFAQYVLGVSDSEFKIQIHRNIMNLMTGFDGGKLYYDKSGIIFEAQNTTIKFVSGNVNFPDLRLVHNKVKEIDSFFNVDAKACLIGACDRTIGTADANIIINGNNAIFALSGRR